MKIEDMDYTKLFSLDKPVFYITTMDTDAFEKLRWNLTAHHKNAGVRFVRGQKSKTLNDFFNEVSASFQFPLYFGENWYAFSDCITDLEWFRAEAYIMLISDASSLLCSAHPAEFSVLIAYLTDANQDWLEPMQYWPPERDRQPTPFHVVFQCSTATVDDFARKLKESNGEFEILGQMATTENKAE